MTTEFFIPMAKVPTCTHQEKQVHVVKGKPVFYEPDELKAARAKLMAHLGQHVPTKHYEGVPLRVVVKWLFPITGKHYHGEWKTSKPDLDNLNKLFADVCTELGFWKDDCIIASLIPEKFYADIPGIYVKIEVLQQPPRPPKQGG